MNAETNQIEKINVTFLENRYSIPLQIARQIGFLSGMIDSGLVDDLELPQHENPVVCKMAGQVLGHLQDQNQSYSINCLRNVILGGLSNIKYLSLIKAQQHDESMIARVRSVLEQVFSLLVLADYWDCKVITMECTEFLALHLSIAGPFSVKKWFTGIV